MSVPVTKLGDPNPKHNLLLSRLEQEDYEVLTCGAKVVSLRVRKRLYRQDEPIDFVYFPITCALSLLVASADKPLEVARVGREGVVGASEVSHGQGAIGLHIIQLPGTAMRIGREHYQKITETRPQVQALMQRHFFALMRQVFFDAACHRLHTMEERCARWLLMTHDRAGQNHFPLTQEFLSNMLGVRRATINGAIGALKKAGLIGYVRGHVTLIDRPGLESASCDCYHAMNKSYESILGASRLRN